MTCFLCMQHTADAAGHIEFDSSEAELLNVRSIIERHFWLRTNDAGATTSSICFKCWQPLLEFHNFYVSVEQAHKALPEIVAVTVASRREAYTEAIKHEGDVESVAAAVKRRRGRPRKVPPLEEATSDCQSELKAVLEQINLNEIKIEFPEADLTIADVLEDQEDDEEDEEHDVSDFLQQSASESDDAEQTAPLKKPRKSKNKLKSVKSQGDGVNNMQKSQEFNEFIKEHYKVHCQVCSTPLEDFSELLVHSRSVHKQRGYATCCGRKFWKRGVLVDHLRRHQDPEIFKCHICDRVMGQRRSLELHMRMHDIKKRGRLHQCDQCSKTFYSSVVCERHRLTHIPKEQCQVSCSSCEKTFPTEYTMQQHYRLTHLNLYAKICDVCGKSIRGREALARHMEEHAGAPQQSIKCHLCGSTLTTKYGLARHIKMMHTAENLQPMQCEICFKISPSLQAYQHHIKYTHNTARNHQCPMCEKAFKRPNELREHMTTHTGEVLYTCPHCPKTFNSNANMHAHRKKVHRKEWEENRHQRISQAKHRHRNNETIIALSVKKTTASTTTTTMTTMTTTNSEAVGLEC